MAKMAWRLVHFILFGVHDMLPAVDLRLLECLLGLQLIPDEPR
jgi:hypothetical protein